MIGDAWKSHLWFAILGLYLPELGHPGEALLNHQTECLQEQTPVQEGKEKDVGKKRVRCRGYSDVVEQDQRQNKNGLSHSLEVTGNVPAVILVEFVSSFVLDSYS